MYHIVNVVRLDYWVSQYEGKFPMFEQVFKNIDDVLRKGAGCTTELDYAEQSS